MTAFLPTDVNVVEHVFDLRQLIELLNVAGHIRLPEGSRVLGAEVTAQGLLMVAIAHGPARRDPNTAAIKVRHNFIEEIVRQTLIKADAEAGKERLKGKLDALIEGKSEGLKTFGTDFRSVTRQMMEEQRFQEEQQRLVEEQTEQSVPLAEEVRSEHTRPLHTMPVAQAVNEMKYRVKDLYPKAHPEKTFTPYAFVFQNSPLERDSSDVVLPFIPGEGVLNVLERLKKLAYEREMSLQMYECFNGIVQEVHRAGTLATAEAAKSYLRPQNYLIVFPPEEAVKKAA